MADSPVIKYVQTRSAENAAMAREKNTAEQQLQIFPNWPEDRRGVPNTVVRSAIFGVVAKGRRVRVVDMLIAAPDTWHVVLTGWRLDQADLDVWLEVLHMGRNANAEHSIMFNLNDMLRRLGRKGDGGTDRAWVEKRLKTLAETIVSFENENHKGSGSILGNFKIEKKTGEISIQLNKEIRPLFEFVTHLDIERRRSLGSNQLAKAMHAMISTHADWLPMRVETVMQRVGANYSMLKSFRRDLRAVLADFQARGWIQRWAIKSDDLVHIELCPTPSQLRNLEKQSGE